MNNELDAILEKCKPVQIQWIIARLTARTDAAAAREVGVARATVARWKHDVDLDRAVKLLLQDSVRAAALLLREATSEAAQKVIDLMRASDSENVTLGAIREILDRGGVPATAHTEQTGEVIIHVQRDDD